MRVLAVTTWYPSPPAPAAGVFVRKDCQALQRDHDLTVVHLAPLSSGVHSAVSEHDGQLPLVRLPLDVRRPVQTVRSLVRLHRLVRDAELVHTMAFSSLLPLVVRRPRAPWVHTEHWSGISAPWSLSPRLRWVTKVLSAALARPDVVAAVCEFLAVPVRQHRSGPTVVVPCIVEQLVQQTPRPAPGPELHLVAVGGLVEGKCPHLAVRAVAELVRRGVACRLTWVGGGPLAASVRTLAEDLGVGHLVDLVGSVEAGEVASYLARADLFLLPTAHENFCVSAAEALLAGRPVVVGSHGGQAEYVDDEVGRLVMEQTPEAYADAVQEVLGCLSDAPAQHFSRQVAERFSRDSVRKGYRATYALAIDSRRPRTRSRAPR